VTGESAVRRGSWLSRGLKGDGLLGFRGWLAVGPAVKGILVGVDVRREEKVLGGVNSVGRCKSGQVVKS
jgi:hypothetical protein